MSFQVNNPVIGFCHIGLGPGRVESQKIDPRPTLPCLSCGNYAYFCV